jgi:hypothetical protein
MNRRVTVEILRFAVNEMNPSYSQQIRDYFGAALTQEGKHFWTALLVTMATCNLPHVL